MPNPLVKLAVTTVNGIGKRQGRTYSVQRMVFEPSSADHVQQYGFNLLGETWKTPSRGLHQIPPAQLQEFARFLAEHATDTAFYADNCASDSLYRQGHTYEYRSPLIPISAEAVAFIREEPRNSVRLLMRAFTNDALELPAGTVARMRERMKSGARDGALFRELRADPAVRAYQQTQWNTRAPVAGDVMLGHNSIVVNTRHERYLLDDERHVVDIINPATREFHILDGSVVWLRIVDTTAHRLVFAVIGTGRHRHALMDAFNIWGAMTIWHSLALVQRHLYDGVPAASEEIAAHISRARQKSGAIAQKLDRTLKRGDTDSGGTFLRRLRARHAVENGDGYMSTGATEG